VVSGTIVHMASLALFHSVYGLRPAVCDAADRLRAAGHQVVTPDLYGVPAVDSLDEAFALADKVGYETILGRAREALQDLPADAVLAGHSMGTGLAGALLAERPQAAGLLLFAGAGSAVGPVPAGLRAQLHVADPDDFAAAGDVDRWVAAMTDAGAMFEVYRYPGVGHLWIDPDLPDHDGPAADLAWERCAEFLRLS
jgi:dienelactone hydrolase